LLTADPRFIDADGPDNGASTADDNLRLQSSSPAIDAGDNSAVPAGVTTDLGGMSRFVDHPYPDWGNGPAPIVDMGAYETGYRISLPLVLQRTEREAYPTPATALPATKTPTSTVTPTSTATWTLTATATGTPPTPTPTATSAPADLRITWWRWDAWLYGGCPRAYGILALEVTNAGGSAAGPFLVQDGQVLWQLAGIEPGDTVRWSEWGPYPRFPLVVDAYGQVAESNEDNNVVGPGAGPTWTSTPAFSRSRATPRPRRRSVAETDPVVPMTQPPTCPPRTPVPTLTPSGNPPLPDLEVVGAVWDRLAVQMPGAAGLCIPADEPWRFEVTIRNSGDAAAGWFSVAGGAAAWRVPGLGAGQSFSLRSQPRFLPESVNVDVGNWVEESEEDNNTWTLPPGGTPTPKTRSLPFCDPTPTPTTTATGTPPTATATPGEALPDLAIDSVYIAVDPSTYCQPGQLGTWVRVSNVGQAAAEPFRVRVMSLHHDAPGLRAGASLDLWFEGYIRGDEAETVAEVDVGNRVHESREDNNVIRERLPIPKPPATCTSSPSATPATGTPPPMPDLVPDFTYRWECCWPCPGDEPYSVVCIKNRGNAPAEPAVNVLEFNRVHEVLDSPTMVPGGSVCRRIPSVSLGAIADVRQAVAESNEDNNRGQGWAPTYAPPPTCTASPTP